MSALLDAVRAELDAAERHVLEAVAEAFEDTRQRLTTLAVEPHGRDARAEPGTVSVGRVEVVRGKKKKDPT